MRPSIDLYLLKDSLTQLSDTTYFSNQLQEFSRRLTAAVEHVIENLVFYGPAVVREFANHVRGAHRYLSGSTTKEAPYEMEFCLKNALKDWTKRDCIITTALTPNQDFHFRPADPWAFVKTAITNFDSSGYDPLLVQLGLPGLYKHKPIFCIPLYHELGHFVDTALGVTRLSLLTHPVSPPFFQQMVWSHRQEHFCDLFAAAYVGRSSIKTLEIIAPSAAASITHPATNERVVLVDTFLSGGQHAIIDMLQSCLSRVGARSLTKFYVEPDLKADYDDVRTHRIASSAQLHGIFESSWNYLVSALDKNAAPWIQPSTAPNDIERIVNDLTEKSIRNMSILERWQSGAAS